MKEAAKRSAASLFDYFLRHNDVGGGFKLFLLHFILQIVSAYTQNSHKAEPHSQQAETRGGGRGNSALTAD